MDNLVEQFASKAYPPTGPMDLHYTNKQSNYTKHSGLRHLDPETDFKVRRIIAQVNETAHIAVNEPSMGLFRIQEHVHRTLPQLVQRKTELKENLQKINDTLYDLNLSVDVIDSMSYIPHFTRIQEAMKTAIETKRKLNIKEEQERTRLELNAKKAERANRSLSQNEPAEGFICPVCKHALQNQDALISHWQEQHSLDTFANDCFEDVAMPVSPEPGQSEGGATSTKGGTPEYIVEQDNDLTVIDIRPNERLNERQFSECEDVVKSFVDEEDILEASLRLQGTNEDSASPASSSGRVSPETRTENVDEESSAGDIS